MINKAKYSKAAFEAMRNDPEALKRLLVQLEDDVVASLQTVIQPVMRRVVDELNSVGHELKDNHFEDPDETDFCEHHGDETQETCGFRLGSTIVVHAGYYKLEAEGISELFREPQA